MNILLSVIPAAIAAIICGFLCAMSQGKAEDYYDIFITDVPPKDLEDYMKAPLALSFDEAVKLEDYSTRKEISEIYQDITSLIEQRAKLEDAVKEQQSVPIGYALSAIAVLYLAYVGVNVFAALVCSVASHFFFFNLVKKKHDNKLTLTNWACNTFRGEYYADSVYPCVYQARMSVRNHYELVKSIYATNKTGRQFYLFVAVIVAFVTVFPR